MLIYLGISSLMYIQIISTLSEPLISFFMFFAPIWGIYVAYLIGRHTYKKFSDKNFLIRVIPAALVLAMVSGVSVLLSGFFAAGVETAECSIRKVTECGMWDIFIVIPYMVFGIIISILSFLCALFIFRKSRSETTQNHNPLTRNQKLAIFLFPSIFVGTFLLYLPTADIAVDVRTEAQEKEKLQKISLASEDKYICGVSSFRNTIDVYEFITVESDTAYVHHPPDPPEELGKFQGSTLFSTRSMQVGYARCYNSNGENFKEKFSIQSAQ